MRLMLTLALFAPSAVHAQPAQSPLPSEVRLSDAEKEKVLEEAAARQRGQVEARDEIPGQPIQGEVGFSISTGGYRSGYGTAYVPLGDDSLAIITVDSTDFGSRRQLPGPWQR